METPKILIVTKQSKYEYEIEKFKLTDEELKEKYKHEHANLNAILSSHEAQINSRTKIKELLPYAEMIPMNKLKETTSYSLIISFGGDNSFTYTSHYAGDTPIIGINSDPLRSVGALCMWSSKDLEETIETILKEEYEIENWTRLKTTINDEKITSATSEYYFGEKQRKDMSRNTIEYRGKEYEQKSSGIIIATGAGSTGWYNSANRFLFPEGNTFTKTEKKAVFINTEPYAYTRKIGELYAGEIREGEKLIIHSLNDEGGTVSCDSWEEYDFIRGKTAVIEIGEPLRVITPISKTYQA